MVLCLRQKEKKTGFKRRRRQMEKKLPESLQKLIKKVEEAFPEDPRICLLYTSDAADE